MPCAMPKEMTASTIIKEEEPDISNANDSRSLLRGSNVAVSPSKSLSVIGEDGGTYLPLSEDQSREAAKYPLGCRVVSKSVSIFKSIATIDSIAANVASRVIAYKLKHESLELPFVAESELLFAPDTLVWALIPQFGQDYVSATVHAAYQSKKSHQGNYTLITQQTKSLCTNVKEDAVFHRSLYSKLPDSSWPKTGAQLQASKPLQEQVDKSRSIAATPNSKDQNITLEKVIPRNPIQSPNATKEDNAKAQQEQHVDKKLAQQAVQLAAQAIASPEVAKNLLHSMPLVRINPRVSPVEPPPRGTVITDGFFWEAYPPLKMLMGDRVREYYALSVTKGYSEPQQDFYDTLIIEIREEASKHGWSFASNFNNKALRDRIRSFFNKHIYHPKKRLRKMIENPTKKTNAKALVAHLQLIQQHSSKDEQHRPIFHPVTGDYGKVDVAENTDQRTMQKIKTTSTAGSSSDDLIPLSVARNISKDISLCDDDTSDNELPPPSPFAKTSKKNIESCVNDFSSSYEEVKKKKIQKHDTKTVNGIRSDDSSLEDGEIISPSQLTKTATNNIYKVADLSLDDDDSSDYKLSSQSSLTKTSKKIVESNLNDFSSSYQEVEILSIEKNGRKTAHNILSSGDSPLRNGKITSQSPLAKMVKPENAIRSNDNSSFFKNTKNTFKGFETVPPFYCTSSKNYVKGLKNRRRVRRYLSTITKRESTQKYQKDDQLLCGEGERAVQESLDDSTKNIQSQRKLKRCDNHDQSNEVPQPPSKKPRKSESSLYVQCEKKPKGSAPKRGQKNTSAGNLIRLLLHIPKWANVDNLQNGMKILQKEESENVNVSLLTRLINPENSKGTFMIKARNKLKISKCVHAFKKLATYDLPEKSKWCSLHKLAILNPDYFDTDGDLACVSTANNSEDEAMLWLGIIPTRSNRITEFWRKRAQVQEAAKECKISLEFSESVVNFVVISDKKDMAQSAMNIVNESLDQKNYHEVL